MKQWLVSSALALSLASGSVLAGQPNQQDMEMIFAQQDQPIQAEQLSQYEMVETEGKAISLSLPSSMTDPYFDPIEAGPILTSIFLSQKEDYRMSRWNWRTGRFVYYK